MTDRPPTLANDAARRLRARYAAERRFQVFGLGAILVAGALLAVLVISIVANALPAFTQNEVKLTVAPDWSRLDAAAVAEIQADRALSAEAQAAALRAALRRVDLTSALRQALADEFPGLTDRALQRRVRGLVSPLNAVTVREMYVRDPGQIGAPVTLWFPLSDDVDSALKRPGFLRQSSGAGALAVTIDGPQAAITAEPGALASLSAALFGQETSTGVIPFSAQTPSVFVLANGGLIGLTAIDGETAAGEVFVKPQTDGLASEWSFAIITEPQADRRVGDAEIAWITALQARDKVRATFAHRLFTRSDSNEPELAGVLGALVGSVYTMLVTMILAAPLGVGAAIYLEEFAPKNALTDAIEVNINNLAAVPSIVFGLLGLAVFINVFGVPRSTPLVGGMVLALMTLPTVIIATRAALRAVPGSIRSGALAMGASPMQVVFDHVLPLALPGILTGCIIGLAQALGETAPLLMIGMVAFVADTPSGVTDAAQTLPVQIFNWSSAAERAFSSRTSAAILILLGLMVVLNLTAVVLRRRFERRW